MRMIWNLDILEKPEQRSPMIVLPIYIFVNTGTPFYHLIASFSTYAP
jgi:hypothetical protein